MTNNKIYLVANWKMYGNTYSIDTLKNVIKLVKLSKYNKAKIVYCPPFTLLDQFYKNLSKTKISVGAQDCYIHNDYGPYTGNISATQIKHLGASYVILGHSEKRFDGDDNKLINLKIKNAIKNKLKVILCIGEKLTDKNNNKTIRVLNSQILACLKNIKPINNLLIAYEPVWAIGSGRTPSVNEINYVVNKIREIILKRFKIKNIKVIYGGSVNPKNIKYLKNIKNINGFLIGGASQKQNKFIDIIKKTIN